MEDAKAPEVLRADDLGDDASDSYTASRMAYELAIIASFAAEPDVEWVEKDGPMQARLLPGVDVQVWQACDMPPEERFGFCVVADGTISTINASEDSIFGDLWHIADRQIRARIAEEQPERIRLLHRINQSLRSAHPEQAKRIEEKLSA